MKELNSTTLKETHWNKSVKQGLKALAPRPTLRAIDAETVPQSSTEGAELRVALKGPGRLKWAVMKKANFPEEVTKSRSQAQGPKQK